MDADPFIRWALDDARTLEERYTTELLVDKLEQRWCFKHLNQFRKWEETVARNRERYLNPAYQPSYSERDLRRAAEFLSETTDWKFDAGYQIRPITDLAVLRFLPALEKLDLTGEVRDLNLLAELPRLRDLVVTCPPCADFRPLARCSGLRRLVLRLGVHWPEVAGLENLQQLEELELAGNLLVFPRGVVFPRVRRGKLECRPLHARNVHDLPQYPACEFLHLSGVERLHGIETMPHLRNLTVAGPVEDFTPLAQLQKLTCFSHSGALPLEVGPLTRIPSLLVATFQTEHQFGREKAPPRDYAPLAASPTLRQVDVMGCPPVELEVAALNAALPAWGDRVLLPVPRPLPPLRVLVGPQRMHPRGAAYESPVPGVELPDTGVLAWESRWITKHGTNFMSERLGHTDWGHISTNHSSPHVCFTLECYELLPRFSDFVEAARQLLAHLRAEFTGGIMIALKAPKRQQTAAQVEVDHKFLWEADEEYFARRRQEDLDRIERLHRLRLKQQQGEPIDPAEFSPEPLGWDDEEEETEVESEDAAEGEDTGHVAVQKQPDPDPGLDDDEHPLANNYNLWLHFTLSELWFLPHCAALGLHLLDRDADEEFPDDPPVEQ